MGILLRWFVATLALFALPYLVNGIELNGILTACIVAACLVFLHMVVKPLISFFTLPLNIVTLGLFSLVLNGLFFWFVASIISGFTVRTFTAAVIGAFIISVINWIVGKFAD